jgi:hypothetical protein
MDSLKEFETYSNCIQVFMKQIGLFEYKRLELSNLSDEESIMKINSMTNEKAIEFYQEKLKQHETTTNNYKEEIERVNELHKDELEETKRGHVHTRNEHKKELRKLHEIHRHELEEKENEVNESNKKERNILAEKIRVIAQEKEKEYKITLKNELDTHKEIHTEHVQRLNEKINMKDEHHNVLVLQRDEKISDLKVQNKSLEDKYNDTQCTVKEFIGERMLKDTEKGDHAENVITEIVSRGLHFDDKAKHIETAHTAGSGDCIIVFSQKYNNLRLMVEMKFRKTIPQKELKQFTDHYTDDFHNDKIDLAILISYDQKNITDHGCCLVHQYDKHNKKVIYFALDTSRSGKEKEEKIINELHEICEEFMRNKDAEILPINDNYICQIEERLRDFKKRETLVKELIKDTTKSLKTLEEEKCSIEKSKNTLLKQLYNDKTIDKINQSLLDENIDQLKKMFFERVRKLMKEKNVSLLPGKRTKWKETLEKELCIEMTSYEKKWWVKIKQTDLV